jgi:excisionase family DNA binding protein
MRRIDETTYITVEEAAVMLGITARTIQRWLSEPHKPKHAPELNPYRFPDGKTYFKQEDIRRYYTRVLGTELSDGALIALLADSRPRRTRMTPSPVAT